MAGWPSCLPDLDPSSIEVYNLGVYLQVVGLCMSLSPRLPNNVPSRSQINRKITTSHIGYEVLFDEERNIWFAPGLMVESTYLSHLRRMIDQCARRTRELNIRAFLLGHDGFSIVPVTVVRFDADQESAWISEGPHGRHPKQEEKVDRRRLIEDNSQNRKLLLAWRDASIALNERIHVLTEFRDRIPRMSNAGV